jgi:dimeric dUTPase (all-alpha-NTP-PPase superfamily)
MEKSNQFDANKLFSSLYRDIGEFYFRESRKPNRVLMKEYLVDELLYYNNTKIEGSNLSKSGVNTVFGIKVEIDNDLNQNYKLV